MRLNLCRQTRSVETVRRLRNTKYSGCTHRNRAAWKYSSCPLELLSASWKFDNVECRKMTGQQHFRLSAILERESRGQLYPGLPKSNFCNQHGLYMGLLCLSYSPTLTQENQTVCFSKSVLGTSDFEKKASAYYKRIDTAINEDIPALENQPAGQFRMMRIRLLNQTLNALLQDWDNFQSEPRVSIEPDIVSRAGMRKRNNLWET